jgi:hypothetical protein
LVWTSSKLLVLESRFVNSVKLNLFVLEEDFRLSMLGRTVPSSDVRFMAAVAARETPDISVAFDGMGGLDGTELTAWFGRDFA